jgi:flagellar biogenesis protein FliO
MPGKALVAVLILALAPPAFALMPRPQDKRIDGPFATSPISLPAPSDVKPSIPTPPSAALGEGPVRSDAKLSTSGTRPGSSAWLNRLARKSHGTGPELSWLFMAGMTLALAICGGVRILARRFAPRVGDGAISVIGRVSLSPKHSVYLLRVGPRVLLIGAGPQGAPALLGELDDLPQDAASSEDGGQP